MRNVIPSVPEFLTLDSQGKEHPSGFSHQEAVQQIYASGLLHALQNQCGEENLNIEQWPSIQDASFHTEIVLKHLNPLFPEDRYSLKLSNFGNLAQVSALDESELSPETFESLFNICAEAGYSLLHEDILYKKWEDTKGAPTTASKRFFSYV